MTKQYSSDIIPRNMKKFIISLVLALAVLVPVGTVKAAEATCTTTYGQGVVCGVTTPEEHITVKAGLKEDLRVAGVAATMAAAAFYFVSNKKKSRFVDELLES